MTSERRTDDAMDHYLGCFGNYRSGDAVCRKRCALRLRCAIEYEQIERFEILEELASATSMMVKIQ